MAFTRPKSNMSNSDRESDSCSSEKRDAIKQTKAGFSLWKTIASIISVLSMAVAGLSPIGIAEAADSGDSSNSGVSASKPYLTIQKSVDNLAEEDLTPGQSFTYKIQLNCSEQNCVNAQMSDALPADLNGFKINSVAVTSTSTGLDAQTTWTENGVKQAATPTTVGSGTSLSVSFNEPFAGGTGLSVGTTAYVNVTLQVPDDFSPNDVRNGKTITNIATSSADNSTADSDSADIKVVAKQTVAAGITKSWSPSTQTTDPGEQSTITLTPRNASNVTVDSMTVQDPADSTAPDGATSLDANNPFRITDFDGFGSATLLPGASSVQIDAYVEQNGTWTWVTGAPGSSYALPAGVSDSQVGGLRFTYTGSIDPAASTTIPINVTQRGTDRNTSKDITTLTSTVDNVAQAQTKKDDTSSAVAKGDAKFTITPIELGTSVGKSFAAGSIPAGNSTVATIKATNAKSPVKEMKISDDADGTFFDQNTTFAGFTQGIAYPSGASTAKVVYHMLDGSADQSVDFADGAVPASPSGNIEAFDIIFGSSTDSIVSNASTTIKYSVATSKATVADNDSVMLNNSVTSTVTMSNDQSSDATNDADLRVVKPEIGVTLDKSISPASNVEAGKSVVVDLKSTTSAKSDYVKPDTIVVTDSWNSDTPTQSTSGFWNAFNLNSIQPTQLLSDTALKVEVQKSDGTWITLDSVAAQDKTSTYQLTAAQLKEKLSDAGVTSDSLIGIRFTFSKPAGQTFATSTIAEPYIGFTARNDLRKAKADGTTATDTVDGTSSSDTQTATSYQNTAMTEGSGTTDDGQKITGDATKNGSTSIIAYPGGSGQGGSVDIAKKWDRESVAAQSSDVATTKLSWRVSDGMKEVSIEDGTSDADVSSSVFNAFNLTSINGIGASSTPYTNGWYLKYDTISSVELYYAGSWHTVAAPSGTWQQTDGSFKGYKLSADETAQTTDVRITLVDDAAADTARTQALQNGTDPYAPEPGSGVVSSSGNREFDLVWTLRNKARSDGSFITQNSALNVQDTNGVVDNAATITGTPSDTAESSVSDTDDDRITIIDNSPSAALSKTEKSDSVIVPAAGTVDSTKYPTNQYVLTAVNTSETDASYVRVTDPLACADTTTDDCLTAGTAAGATSDPFMSSSYYKAGTIDDASVPNPFNEQNITKVTIASNTPAGAVDLSKSIVWLLHYTPGNLETGVGTYTTTSSTAADVNAMTASQLADVVGVSVTFQGSDPANNGGSIPTGGLKAGSNVMTVTLDTQVRSALRSTNADFTVPANGTVSSTNRALAQSYDPVTNPTTQVGDLANAAVQYSAGTLDIQTSKNISDADILVTKTDDPQTITLNANQGASTVSPKEVDVTDAPDSNDASQGSTSFWTDFEFTGLSGITFPAGSDQVAISAYLPSGSDGAYSWVSTAQQSSDSAQFLVPVSSADYSKIRGLKFVFTNKAGTIFSTSTPNWSGSIVFTAVMRASLQKDGSFSGATNMVKAQSEGAQLTSSERTATAGIASNQGQPSLAVDKLANNGVRSASIGSMVPWDITIRNTGNIPLNLTGVTDTLPSQLQYTGAGSGTQGAVVFTAGKLADGTAGSLSTDPTLDVSDSGVLTFTWPKGMNEMQPGETAVIRVWLELEPGASSGQKVVNTVDVKTQQTLDGVSDAIQGNGTGAVTEDTDSQGASTSDYVTPTSGENLFIAKGVIGSLSGAENISNPSQTCLPTLTGLDGEKYYRSPCVANSETNGTDQWILHMVNAGTTSIKKAQLFDQLPSTDDKYLIDSSTSRGTTYDPEMIDDLKLSGVPDGTTQTVEVTTDSNACVDAWSSIPSAASACGANEWSAANGDTDWSKVKGIRITLDFTTSAQKALLPGQTVDASYSTVNVPKSAANPDGAPTDVPSADQFAYNQYGILYTGQGKANKLATNLVGVHLLTGSIQVEKKAEGAASSYAPSTIYANVSCTIPASPGSDQSVPLTFGDSTTDRVALERQSDGTYKAQRISGIPLGATCSVSEDESNGTYGETSKTISVNGQNQDGDSASIAVDKADTYASDSDSPSNDVDASQVAALTNNYDYSSLSVTKKLDTKANVGSFGPFKFTLSCKTSDGQTVQFGDGDATTFSLNADQTWESPSDTIPANSKCVLEETDSDNADSSVLTGDNVSTDDQGNQIITVGSESDKVTSTTMTNHYDAGTVTVSKKVDGQGAARYGSGDFDFQIQCTYGEGESQQQLLDKAFTLKGGESQTFGVMRAGSICKVTEVRNGGATSSSLDPENGTVTVARQSGDDVSNVQVNVTNSFASSALKIIKKRTGAAAASRGVGPFTAKVACTYLADGQQKQISLDNGGVVKLSAANGYEASVDDIINGAQCVVKETDDGGADSSSMDPADGRIQMSDDASKNVVTITNVFNAKPTPKPVNPSNGGSSKNPSNPKSHQAGNRRSGTRLAKTGAAIGIALSAAALLMAVGVTSVLIARAKSAEDPTDGAGSR